MNWRDLKIKWKLTVGFSAILGCLVLFTAMTWHYATNTKSRLDRIRDESARLALQGKEMQFHNVQVQQWLTDISATRGMEGFDDGFDEAADHAAEFRKRLDDFRSHYEQEQDVESLRAINELGIAFDGFYTMGRRMAQEYIDNGPEAGNLVMEEFDPYAASITEKLNAFVDQQEEELLSTIQQASDDLTTIVEYGTVFAAIGLIGSVFIVWLTNHSITTPLRLAVQFAEQVAAGNASDSVSFCQNDEIGELGRTLQAMARRMQGDLEESSVAAHEMSRRISNVSAKSSRASRVASDATELAQTSNENIRRLGVAATEIGKVIDTIQGIAEQTNLLALNATIEAARAGDAGSGFAVVANEVKELARQTASATDEIHTRIHEIQGTTDFAIESIGQIVSVISDMNEVSMEIASVISESAYSGTAY
ncbi:MAG: HAMP domain-containing protein [Planctomycetaceae bacterium]|nr:HAMP domain-containing protein [Planctomycetaceae bacterium]